MTLEIALVLFVLLGSLVLFVTEWLRMDLVALLVLAVLAVTGLVSPAQALSGFSNPAVVTVWAMFILSAALTRAGVAGIIGRRVLGWAGRGETRIVTVIMLTSAVLSAFMNNIGVAALMLPVVLDIARRTGRPPSRLLMPLAYGTLLGGLTTLIGTPPNLLVADALRAQGERPFGMFDYTPVGGGVMIVGIAFVAVVGRRLLPRRDPAREASSRPDQLEQQYRLDERSAVLRIPMDSQLADRTLGQSRIGQATGLNVYALLRGRETLLAPGPGTLLHPGDRLLVEGPLDRYNEMREWQQFTVDVGHPALDELASAEIGVEELTVAPDSPILGRTLRQIGFRRQFGGIVLALRRDSRTLYLDLATTPLEAGDRLLVQARRSDIETLREAPEFESPVDISEERLGKDYHLREQLFTVHVPSDSLLEGRSLAQGRIGDALGLGVLGFKRGETMHLLPEPDTALQGGDLLLVRGRRDDLDVFRGLQGLEIGSETAPDLRGLESDREGMFEAMLSPRTSLTGKTLGELRFRERYGVQVLALLREGEVLRANLRDVSLRFGDALLLLGPRDRAAILDQDPDFLVLSHVTAQVVDRTRAPLAAMIMAAVLVPVLAGWLPIAVSAVAGAALMVLTRCIPMDEAYRSIEWRSIFLIAGMLPLGVALQQSGAAAMVAEGLLETVGSLGPWGVLVCLYLITAAATMIIPTAALVVLMAPIAFRAETGVSEHAVMMAVAMAASASFTSPVSHPANILVMGPGGYRFVDYVKLGVPLTLIVLVVVLLLLPWYWPL
jgi:di/tricarboxylate transporter